MQKRMDNRPTPYEALIACREAAGSDSQMARDLGTNQPRIWRIMNSSKRLPAEYVLTAERHYGVLRHYLRPDIYPPSDWKRVPPMVRAQQASRAPRRARSRQKSIAG